MGEESLKELCIFSKVIFLIFIFCHQLFSKEVYEALKKKKHFFPGDAMFQVPQ